MIILNSQKEKLNKIVGDYNTITHYLWCRNLTKRMWRSSKSNNSRVCIYKYGFVQRGF